MSAVKVRKFATLLDEIFHEGGPAPATPFRRGAIAAVIHNPFAGKYVADIQPFMDDLKPLGLDMAKRLLASMGNDPKKIGAYGKGGIVGISGELEHGHLWHQPGGYSMREVLGGAKAIVPSTTKIASPGTGIDIPVHHINAAYVRSHFETITVRVEDSPRPDEIMFIIAMTTGARIHDRCGGLRESEISVGDGQR